MPRADVLRLRTTAAPRALWQARAEILTSLAMIGGWASLTAGVVGFFPGHAAAIWRVSIGLLLFSLAGWKFSAIVARTGLYTLTRGKDA